MESDKKRLVEVCNRFLDQIKDLTPNAEVERWLNDTHGPGSPVYEELARLIRLGVEQGWAAEVEIDGSRYRRNRLCSPSEATSYFSITTVYMDSSDNLQANPENALRGQYHGHPYGEFNMVVPITPGAAIMGPNGWCYGGWTAPPPGSHHFPEVKGGALIAFFFLPAGRISYTVQPTEAVPY